MSLNVKVVVGGQYGSEAKGHVTAQLVAKAHREANEGTKIYNIRVAGPNAGHTAYDANGNKFAFRSLPIGAIVHPDTLLYIAPGSEIDLEVLRDEIRVAREAGHEVSNRLFMSKQVTILEDKHKKVEATEELTKRVGSTGKGIGAARIDRLNRTARIMSDLTDEEVGGLWFWAEPEDLYATDKLVHDNDIIAIVEGTQGYGLSLRASGNYPFTTSSDCRSMDFLAMAGIDATRCKTTVENYVVARVHPIRVAGNSGYIKDETTWEELGLPEEFTTVTNKVRRVGMWDIDLVRSAVQANGGHNVRLVITMLDQVVPELKDTTTDELLQCLNEGKLTKAMEDSVEWLVENAILPDVGCAVWGYCFSPTRMVFMEEEGKEKCVFDMSDPKVIEYVNAAHKVKKSVEKDCEEKNDEAINDFLDMLDVAFSEDSDLMMWWLNKAFSEVIPLIKKMKEYGGNGKAIDLEEIGRALAISGVKLPDNEDSTFSETGIYFYLVGKFARWTAAVSEGRKVSDDTLHDIGIYVRMVQRIRETGEWSTRYNS